MYGGKWFANWLTRGYVRTLDSSGVSREESYEAHGEEKKVFWVNAEEWPMAGQYTPAGTILLNEDKLGEVPEEVVDYIFLHEVGHSKLPRVLGLISIALRIPLMLLAIIGLPTIVIQWLFVAASTQSARELGLVTIALIVVIFVILFPVLLIYWLDEGYAELFVISKIGAEAYKRCIKKKKEYSDGGMWSRILAVLYPPPSLILWIADLNRRWQ